MGIEPTYSAWKADALPLSYARLPEDKRCKPSNSSPIKISHAPGVNGVTKAVNPKIIRITPKVFFTTVRLIFNIWSGRPDLNRESCAPKAHMLTVTPRPVSLILAQFYLILNHLLFNNFCF